MVGTGNPGQASVPNKTANFADVAAAISGFQGGPFPFIVPDCP
jgi:hypothetical protein